jgi:hypothetical protein
MQTNGGRVVSTGETPMLDAGGYVALALLVVEVVLIFSLVRRKTTKGVFALVSLVILFAVAFFWMGDRVTEMTIRGIGTIKTAANLAAQYVEDIKNIKTDIEKQKQVITTRLKELTQQIDQAQQLTKQLKQQQEYSDVARHDAFGLLGLASPPLEEKSALNDIFGRYVHSDPAEFRFDCTPEAISAYASAIAFDIKFPFPYYYRGICNKMNNTGDLAERH